MQMALLRVTYWKNLISSETSCAGNMMTWRQLKQRMARSKTVYICNFLC